MLAKRFKGAEWIRTGPTEFVIANVCQGEEEHR
jgi:hypothetical protein